MSPRRRAPRSVAAAIEAVVRRSAPATPLAEVLGAWEAAVGPDIAGHARPESVKDGILIVNCESSVWANELSLMGPELAGRVACGAPGAGIRELRFRTAPS